MNVQDCRMERINEIKTESYTAICVYLIVLHIISISSCFVLFKGSCLYSVLMLSVPVIDTSPTAGSVSHRVPCYLCR